jgi:hypothetical protein
MVKPTSLFWLKRSWETTAQYLFYGNQFRLEIPFSNSATALATISSCRYNPKTNSIILYGAEEMRTATSVNQSTVYDPFAPVVKTDWAKME